VRLVILESPYAGDVERNLRFAKACVMDCLDRGESAFASHLYFTLPGLLDDGKPAERELGIEAGLAWGRVADATVVYENYGITRGMRQGIQRAIAGGRPVEYRTLKEWSDA
jgi:hypothetical protein